MNPLVTQLESVSDSEIEEFNGQVTEFFDAVSQQQGPAFYKHLSKDLFVYSILPFDGGKQITDFDEYLRFHEWWMAQKDRTWHYKIDRVLFITPVVATVTITANYFYPQNGKQVARVITISNCFKLKEKIWYLVTNQNTLVSETIGI